MDISTLPFSKFRRVGDTVYLSGQLGFAEDGSLPVGIEAQTARALAGIEEVLSEQSLTRSDGVSCTCYLTDRIDMPALNAVYATFFSEPRPVRTALRAVLAFGARVEISGIAKG